MSDRNDTTREEFRDIPGAIGYRASNLARIQGRWSTGWGARLTDQWRDISPFPDKGYMSVTLRVGVNKRQKRRVHTLVLRAFVGPCPEGMQCLHGDGDKTNNLLTNIRWGTPLENARDKDRHGTTAIGDRNGFAILDDDKVRSIRAKRAAGTKIADLSREFGVSVPCIWTVVSRTRWKHVI